jgi:hypothetical protein
MILAALVAGHRITIGVWTRTGKGTGRLPVTHHLKRFAGYCSRRIAFDALFRPRLP